MRFALWVTVACLFAGLTWWMVRAVTATAVPVEVLAAEAVVAAAAAEAAPPTASSAKFDAELGRIMDRAAREMADAVNVAAKAGQPGLDDPEWTTFKRTKDHLSHLVAANAAVIDVNRLFRNIHLNPTDAYIAKDNREAIRTMVSAAARVIGQLNDLEGRAMIDEIEPAIARGHYVVGNAKNVSWADLAPSVRQEVERHFKASQAEYAELGIRSAKHLTLRSMPVHDSASFVRKYVGDTVYSVPVAAMRTTAACRGFKRFLSCDLGLRILAAFTTLGLVPDETATKFAQTMILDTEEKRR